VVGLPHPRLISDAVADEANDPGLVFCRLGKVGQDLGLGINSNNTTNNVVVNFQNSILKYDASVTNDSSVRTTVIGNNNKVEGSSVNNTIVGTAGIDQLFGYAGNDRFLSSAGDDTFDGGEGLDAVTFEGSKADFALSKVGDRWTVTDRSTSGVREGTDTLVGVERLGFADKAVALDIEGVAGKAYRIYKAAFNRDPMSGDTAGLGFWIGQMDNAMDLIEVSSRFIDSSEFKSSYGTNPTNAQFLTKLYTNVLGRQPEAEGYNWWLNELNTNPAKTKAKVLADFAESNENKSGVLGLLGQGITYDPWNDGGGDGGGGGGGGGGY